MPMATDATTIRAAAAACSNSRRTNRRPGSGFSVRGSYMPEAVLRVVVHHAHGLHVRIADRRADELEAALQQVLAEGVRLRGFHRHLASLEHDRLAADEAPDILVEAAEFLLHGEQRDRIGLC